MAARQKRARMKTALLLLLIVLGFTGFFGAIQAADPVDTPPESAGEAGVTASSGDHTPYPIMRPDRAKKIEWMTSHFNSEPVRIDRVLEKSIPPQGSLSLLSHLPYTPSERNQAGCGNCWIWGGTGVMAIAHKIQNGVSDRLSIQQVNSCMTGVISIDCCDGGWLEDLADFYSSVGYTVPWSAVNAHWQDGDASCDTSCASVATSPNYPISSIQQVRINTHGVGKAAAIANIKNVLHQNKAVWFAFFMGLDSEWTSFFNFWDTQAESAIWDFDPTCGSPWTVDGGGHAVLCVGYDDSDADPSKHYWIMVNSWGTTSGRPNGIFRVAMDMDYDCLDGTYNDYNIYFETLNIEFGADPDIIWRNTSGGFGVWLMNGAAESNWELIGNHGTSWHSTGVGDFNSDGKDDVLWRNSATGAYGVWLMDGATETSWHYIGNNGTSWESVGVGDFNGDNKSDVVWRNSATGKYGLWLMDGTTPSSWQCLGANSLDWRIAGVGDFNNDNQADILWRNNANGNTGVWYMTGTTQSSWQYIGNHGTSWDAMGVGDFNDDGQDDIVWRQASGNCGVWYMTGATESSWQYINNHGAGWTIEGVGDFN